MRNFRAIEQFASEKCRGIKVNFGFVFFFTGLPNASGKSARMRNLTVDGQD